MQRLLSFFCGISETVHDLSFHITWDLYLWDTYVFISVLPRPDVLEVSETAIFEESSCLLHSSTELLKVKKE